MHQNDIIQRMDAVYSIILGLVQGLTEFIPVSSSGHLVIVQHFLNGVIDHRFLECINIGTTIALLVYFRKKIIAIAQQIIEQKKYSLLRNILLTSVPAGIAGLALGHIIDSAQLFNSIYTVIVTLVLVGIVMIILPHVPTATPVKNGTDLPWQRALAIGAAQMLALVPGISRSGSTIIAGRVSGLSNHDAAEYSFLASIPIMIAVTVKLLLSSADRAYIMAQLPELLVGNVVAFMSGLATIGFLLKYLSRHDLAVFGWYRVGLAFVVLIAVLLQ